MYVVVLGINLLKQSHIEHAVYSTFQCTVTYITTKKKYKLSSSLIFVTDGQPPKVYPSITKEIIESNS